MKLMLEYSVGEPYFWDVPSKYYENGKNAQVRKIYDNFRFSDQILPKIINKFFKF